VALVEARGLNPAGTRCRIVVPVSVLEILAAWSGGSGIKAASIDTMSESPRYEGGPSGTTPLSGRSIVGVDTSTDQLAVASPYADSVGAHLVAADASRLPFEAESFDAVISLLTHTDFDNLRTAFREAFGNCCLVRPGKSFDGVSDHFHPPARGQFSETAIGLSRL
jgi:hypothetical protein